jgi:hypothetical protein
MASLCVLRAPLSVALGGLAGILVSRPLGAALRLADQKGLHRPEFAETPTQRLGALATLRSMWWRMKSATMQNLMGISADKMDQMRSRVSKNWNSTR